MFQIDGEIGQTISQKAAIEIIDDIHEHIDSEFGVTSGTLECVLRDYIRENNQNGKMKLLSTAA